MSDIVAPPVSAPVDAPVTESVDNAAPEAKAPVKEAKSKPLSFEEWEAKEAKSESEKSKAATDTVKEPAEVAKEPKQEKDTPKEPKEAESKTFKLKINGREIEVPEAEMVRRAQKADAAEEKFAQASKIQKQAEQMIEMLKTNPGAILGKIGTSKEAVEDFYYKTFVAPTLMTPEQQQLAAKDAEKAELQARLEKYEESEKQAKAEAAKAAHEAKAEQHRVQYAKQFEEALESGGIPKSGWSIRQMAYYMKQALAEGYAHITPKDVLPLVKDDFIKAQREMVASMSPAQLQEYMGEDTVQKLRNHSIEQAKAPKFQNNVDPASVSSAPVIKKEDNKNRVSSVNAMLKNIKF